MNKSAERLKRLINYLGISNNKFGKLIGLTGSQISKIIKEKTPLSTIHAYAIAYRTGADVNWLLHGKAKYYITPHKHQKIIYLLSNLNDLNKQTLIKFAQFLMEQQKKE